MKNLERKSCVRSEKASSNYLMQAPYFIYAVMHASMTGGNTYIFLDDPRSRVYKLALR